MPLFDAYVMVDWSGGSRPTCGPNSIWIAHGTAALPMPQTLNPRTRAAATTAVQAILTGFLQTDGGRILVCFDFPYSFPRGFAQGLPPIAGAAPPWAIVWNWLGQSIADNGANANNRFMVANARNLALSPGAGPYGPFWCKPNPAMYPQIPCNAPANPFVSAAGPIPGMRYTDIAAQSDYPFRIFGQGSVGSQALMGIPRVCHLRFVAVPIAAQSKVWPFETGWAPPPPHEWDPECRIVHAEIYPSVQPPVTQPGDLANDQAQVRAMWLWARNQDQAGTLVQWFRQPQGALLPVAAEATARLEEGWILGT